ncbi:phospholipase D-like domain-containing protein [Clostridium sp.]|uniref:phospholipase D-like domain-containing protein n=1 Tax=Clostridium sp. TaxID=1506 RepID=UPI0025C50E81|nr:phospholipase D-like domain-containing protein [Clostridium sp.]
MIISSPIKEVTFLMSKDELTYEEVLNDFNNANKIFILTYNISKEKNSLLNSLKEAGEDTEIKIISNIPGRWKDYFKSNYEQIAKRNIYVYKNKLNPKQISEKTQVYFCFSNHSKIIMTDNIAYVGSANFSEESSNNFEAGFITRDKEFIEFLEEEVFPWIINYSSEYEIDDKFLLLKTAVYNSVSMFESIYENFHMNFYLLADHRGEEIWYYNKTENTMCINDLEEAGELCNKYLELLEKINNLFQNQNIIEADIDGIDDLIEESNDIVNDIEEIFSGTLYDLATFSKQNYINEYLDDNASEAYDENLDYYVEKGMDIADEVFEELAERAKEDADKLLKELVAMKDISKLVVNKFNEIPENLIKIDNTN